MTAAPTPSKAPGPADTDFDILVSLSIILVFVVFLLPCCYFQFMAHRQQSREVRRKKTTWPKDIGV